MAKQKIKKRKVRRKVTRRKKPVKRKTSSRRKPNSKFKPKKLLFNGPLSFEREFLKRRPRGKSNKPWKILLAGIIFAIIAQVIHNIGAMLTIRYYMDPDFFGIWSKLMMPMVAAPPPLTFFLASALFGLLTGVLYAYVFSIIKNGVPGQSSPTKGLMYGLILILVASVPAMLMISLTLSVPNVVNLSWAVESAVVYLLGGMAIARLLR